MKVQSTFAVYEGRIFDDPEIADRLATVFSDPVTGMMKEGGDEGVDGVLVEADLLRVDDKVAVEGLGDGEGAGFNEKRKLHLSFS
jgi:hypothetical protein